MDEYTVIGGALERCKPCNGLTIHVNGRCQRELMPQFTDKEVIDKYHHRKDMLAQIDKVLARARRIRRKIVV